MAKILVVEDDLDLTEMLQELLQHQQYVVECVADGKDADHCLKTYNYDLIILDWELPGMQGVEVCREARKRGLKTPVIMLTGKTEVDDKIEGLDTGADDYLTKPFSSKELLARVRALMRRPAVKPSEKLQVGDLILDMQTRKVTNCGREINLLPKEFSILEYLMKHPNQVFNGDDLLNGVWASDAEAAPSSVRTQIYSLRKKLSEGDLPCPIQTVHGAGYKIESA